MNKNVAKAAVHFILFHRQLKLTAIKLGFESH